MKRGEKKNEQSAWNHWGCTHNTVLNRRKNIALGSASFEVDVCNVTVASVCFVILIDYS